MIKKRISIAIVCSVITLSIVGYGVAKQPSSENKEKTYAITKTEKSIEEKEKEYQEIYNEWEEEGKIYDSMTSETHGETECANQAKKFKELDIKLNDLKDEIDKQKNPEGFDAKKVEMKIRTTQDVLYIGQKSIKKNSDDKEFLKNQKLFEKRINELEKIKKDFKEKKISNSEAINKLDNLWKIN